MSAFQATSLVNTPHQRTAPAGPRLLFVVNVDWFFLSHRLPLARAARDAGYDVHVAAADTGAAAAITGEGLGFAPLPLSRHGTGPASEIRTFAALLRTYRRLRPDVAHHVTIKPVLYGSLAARMAGVPAVVNAVSGLGSFITAEHRRAGLRYVVDRMYAAALRAPNSRTILQNPDDLELFVDAGLLDRARAVLIRGAGVDVARFAPRPEPDGTPIVMLPARMLWDKGVGVFVDAARLLRERAVACRCVLVGPADGDSFMAVPRAQLEAWQQEGVVEWWGPRTDMHETLARAAVIALPSRREGLPKALLEAAACGRPLIATDVPGCREVVRHGESGVLVPWNDAASLADAIALLVGDRALRERLGRGARAIAEREFAEHIVVAQTLALYRDVLAEVQVAR